MTDISAGSLTLPIEDDKSDLVARYVAAKNFLDNAINDWATLTGSEKQTWVANNMDEVLEIERAILVLLRKILEL